MALSVQLTSRVAPDLAVFDMETPLEDARIEDPLDRFKKDNLQASEFNPDIWRPAMIRDPDGTFEALTHVVGSKFRYRLVSWPFWESWISLAKD